MSEPRLERWDQRAAQSADRYLADSSVVARAIREIYGIEAELLPPPPALVATGPLDTVGGLEPGFWLCVSRLLPYKNVDVVLEAVRLRGDTLVVVGDGPERSRLEARAGPGVSFAGKLSDAQLRWCYANCRALVAASYEDFGLTPLEAAAFGRPSVALRAGGFLDTIVEGETGVLFDAPDAKLLRAAMDELDSQQLARGGTRRSGESLFRGALRVPPSGSGRRRGLSRRLIHARPAGEGVSEGAAPPEHPSRSYPENAQIPPDGPRGDVEVVQSLELVEAQLASAGDLPQPGHARPDLESTLRGPVDRVRFGRDERTWARRAPCRRAAR